jgi:hypothetical protein
MASKRKISSDPNDQTRTRIFNVLKAASTDDAVHNISVTKIGGSDENLMVQAKPDREHVVKIRLKWISAATQHYAGYFVAANDEESQAIISLYNQFDAAQFIVAVMLLGEIAAKVPRKPRAPRGT